MFPFWQRHILEECWLEGIRTEQYKSKDITKQLTGSAVIEMAYIIPLFFLIFVLVLHTVFYFHDKAVLIGAAAETALTGAQSARKKGTAEYDLDEFFRERADGKLIYMKLREINIEETQEKITVHVSAQRNFLKLDICQSSIIVKPEERIRWLN